MKTANKQASSIAKTNLLRCLFLLCVIFLLFSRNGFAQTCSPAPVGLQAWWSADGNALDSRSRNNATLRGGAGFAAGQVGQAFSLNGVTGSAFTAPDNPIYELSSLTLEAWIRVDGLPQSGRLGMVIFRGDDEPFRDPYYLAILPNGKLRFHIETVSGVAEDLETTNPIPLGQFTHVGGTFDASSGEMRIYVNSTLAAPVITTAVRPRLQLNNSLNPGIGIGNIGSTSTVTVLDQIFNGLIDEPAIYNRELSASEIAAIAGAGTAGKCKPTATVSPSGQVGWWAGDGDARDLAGTNNGTLENGANIAVGKVGQSFNFTAQNQSVGIPNNPALFPSTALSVEAWVNLSTYTGCSSHYRIFHTFRAVLRGYAMFIDCASQKLVVELRDPSGVSNAIGSNATIPAGTFTHIAMTWDGSNLRLFINGVLDNTVATTISTIGTNSDALRIGNEFDFGFRGQIDEVSLYNRALTDAEIQSIFNAGIAGKLKQNATINSSSLVSLWQGEGNASDTRNLNNGTLTNGTSFATGKIGQALSFDGVDDFVQLSSNSSLNPTSITVEGWLNPNPIQSSIGGMIYSNRQANISEGFTLGFNAAPISNLIIILQTAGGIATLTSPVNSIESGKFQHVAVTYDETIGTVTALINGLPVSLSISGTLSGPLFAASNPVIGRRETGAGSGNFNGLIDELAIYNRPLSQTEIRANYEAGNALSTVIGDARITFPTVSTAGITQQIPLNLSTLPGLPVGSTTTGLTYDIATTVVFTGSPQVCFDLPSITNSTAFSNLRILHLESSVWTNRTDLASINFATKTICTSGLTSLSPFAVVNGFIPSAALVSISGRVINANGQGFSKVRVSLTDSNGSVQTVLTGAFGYYRFDDVQSGETYILGVRSKRFTFASPTQIISVSDDLSDVDFISNE